MGVRQGGFHGDVTRLHHTRKPFQLHLKIVLVFDPVFGPFPNDFGSPKWSTVDQNGYLFRSVFGHDF